MCSYNTNHMYLVIHGLIKLRNTYVCCLPQLKSESLDLFCELREINYTVNMGSIAHTCTRGPNHFLDTVSSIDPQFVRFASFYISIEHCNSISGRGVYSETVENKCVYIY